MSITFTNGFNVCGNGSKYHHFYGKENDGKKEKRMNEKKGNDCNEWNVHKCTT